MTSSNSNKKMKNSKHLHASSLPTGISTPRRSVPAAVHDNYVNYSYSYDHGTLVAANEEAQQIAQSVIEQNISDGNVNRSNPSNSSPRSNPRGTYFARRVPKNMDMDMGGTEMVPMGNNDMNAYAYAPPSIQNISTDELMYNGAGLGGNHKYKKSHSTSKFDCKGTVCSGGRTLNSEDDGTVYVYNEHGQRVPYYDGPYLVVQHRNGTKERTRWYGRLEDGYIAWISINLFEYFGAVVYQPLNPYEMKRGKIPRWMYDMWSLPNLAIPLSYFCIGVALQLLRTPLIVYFIEDLSASPADVNVLFTVMAVPWCFKVLYGFLSDCIPIGGLRRKPYFMFGWVVYVGCNLILAVTPYPSIRMCIFLVFLQTAGYMLADVMTDALIVERSQYEPLEQRGTMQSMGYIIRFFGSTVGATIGALVYNKDSWDVYLPINLIFFLNAAFPLFFLLPVVPFLMEIETECEARDFMTQCRDLFHTAQLRAVWQPMTFVYVYNALQLTNAAWMNFLVEGLGFTAWMIGLVSIAGSIMSWLGIMTYKKFFFGSNWRTVYFWCTTLASAIAIAQTLLVFGINRKWGISDIWFSMGDDVLVEFVIAVQFLPMCIMYLGLCPEGSEGTTYAMLTTFSNLAGTIAFDISTALTEVWDVSSEAIENGDYDGVWKLSVLCGIVGPIPLFLLGLIPKNKEDQVELQKDTKRHLWGGIIFIAVTILSLFITFAESIWEVWYEDGEHSDGEASYADGANGDDVGDNARRLVSRRLKRLMTGH